jgi:hypothetical protein
MNAEEFVRVVREVVMNAAVDGVIRNLTDGPGRREPELLALSKWFTGLSPDDRDMARRAFTEVSHSAVFRLFAVLDGVKRVDSEQPPGELQLWYEDDQSRIMLSGALHDVLDSEDVRR